MRTTLDIADNVLQTAQERAQREGATLGEMISELARLALTAHPESGPNAVYGLLPFPARGGVVTNDLIETLRDRDAWWQRPRDI